MDGDFETQRHRDTEGGGNREEGTGRKEQGGRNRGEGTGGSDFAICFKFSRFQNSLGESVYFASCSYLILYLLYKSVCRLERSTRLPWIQARST